ncbi:MAG: DUF11 domain-containing protein, partial [Planctomycetales bacterium]|nr:DUF11 domain-containing protein [Planctomycetales bacterium]
VDQLSRATVDIAVRKMAAQTFAVPGRDVQYTIVVANIGQTAVAAVDVADVFPSSLSNIRYTSETIGQATGNTAVGTGNLNERLSLEPGASVIYLVTATVAADATGTLQNVATVQLDGQQDTNPTNNLDLSVVPLIAHADLSITKTDGRTEVEAGEALTYEVVVHNSGPSNVSQVTVTDLIPDGLSNATFTSTAAGGATGNRTSGAGNLNELLTLPVGSSVTYQITGTVAQSVSGVLSNAAIVRGPLEAGFIELDPTNNHAVDTDVLRSTIDLGSEETTIIRDAIVEAGQTDRYRITAHTTGKMMVAAHFDNNQGDLQIAIDDRFGHNIVTVNTDTDDEMVAIPVVAQERYFIRVLGADGEVENRYDLEVENFAAPIPQVLRLTPGTDTGMMNDDAVTYTPNPTVIVQADLADFIAMGVPVLSPADPTVDNTTLPLGPGAAVEVTLTNVQTGEQIVGYATPIGAAGNLYSFTPLTADGLISGDYAVTSAVRIFDGQTDGQQPTPATGRTNRSDPFWITIDRIAPTAADRADLIDASDSGVSQVDNVTNLNQPTFRGVTEPGAKVLIYGTRINGQVEVIGRGVAGTDGQWEITTDPLKDGLYHIRVEYEDLAGNTSTIGEPMFIEVDTTAPNTPLLDLIRTSDTGLSSSDNVTQLDNLTFSMTTEDPNPSQHDQPYNYNFRLYLRPDAGDGQTSAAETLIYDSSLDAEIPVANLLNGMTDLNQLVKSIAGPLPDGVHNFKLEVEDRAGNVSDDFLLTVTIDTVAPPADIEMLTSSDSGMITDDLVTKLTQPAFAGVSEVGSTVYLYANGRLVGQGRVGSDDSDGVPGDGMGAWEITSEPLADGVYSFSTRFEDLAGNTSTSEAFDVWIDTVKPNVPLLDLLTDTGLSSTDNV